MLENFDEVKDLEKKQKNYTHVKIDATCLNYQAEAEKTKILVEDLPFAAEGEDDIIIVELPKKDTTFAF